MQANKGFTMIELSIVIVIVGVVIGGILVANSMSDTAKATRLVKDIQQYTAAVANFRVAYGNTIPGDSASFTPAGDENGVLNGPAASSTFTGEVANFWVHLATFGLKPNGKTLSASLPATNIVTADYNIPALPYGQKGSGIYAVNAAYATAQLGSSASGNQFMLVGPATSTGTTLTTNPAFKINEARALDIKFDDGSPNSGNVKSTGGSCSTGSSYNNAYSINVNICALFVGIVASE